MRVVGFKKFREIEENIMSSPDRVIRKGGLVLTIPENTPPLKSVSYCLIGATIIGMSELERIAPEEVKALIGEEELSPGVHLVGRNSNGEPYYLGRLEREED